VSDPFYDADGKPIIPLTIFLLRFPQMFAVSIFNGRAFQYSWWDFHWRMFCAARLFKRRPSKA
jgi:hypothetical protein